MSERFRSSLEGAWKRIEERQWIYGKAGRINADGTYTFIVPGRPTFIYVTLRNASGSQTTVSARNDGGVPHAPNLNVKMRLEKGVYVVYGKAGTLDANNPATPPSGGEAHKLENHSDVVLTTIAENDMLTWDATTSTWVNDNGSGIFVDLVNDQTAAGIKTWNAVTANFGIDTGAGINVNLNGAAATTRQLTFRTGGLLRWLIKANTDAESGANAGSNLELLSRTDAGSALSTLLHINRAGGMFGFKKTPTTYDFEFSGIMQLERSAGTGTVLVLSATGTGGRIYSIGVSHGASSLGQGKFYVTDSTAGATRLLINELGYAGIFGTSPEVMTSTWTQSSAVLALLNVGGTQYGQVAIRGSVQANLILIDTGAAANRKVMTLETLDGVSTFISLNDDSSILKDDIIRMDHGSGKVYIGHTPGARTSPAAGLLNIETAVTLVDAISIWHNANDAIGPRINLGKSRGTVIGANTAVQSNDELGLIVFYGGDGDGTTTATQAAIISAHSDGAAANIDMPTRLAFWTTADGASGATERMRIDSAGNVDIEAGASTGLEARVGGVLYASDAEVGNILGGEDDLMGYTVPASTMSTDGDVIYIETAFKFANNANSKTAKLYWGSVVVASFASSTADIWVVMRATIVRTSNTTQITTGEYFWTSNFYGFYTAGTSTLSSTVFIKGTGTSVGAATNDIIQKYLIVRYAPANS